MCKGFNFLKDIFTEKHRLVCAGWAEDQRRHVFQGFPVGMKYKTVNILNLGQRTKRNNVLTMKLKSKIYFIFYEKLSA